MALYKCDVCGESTQINSRWRGSFCKKHWDIAQAVDPGPALNGRSTDSDPMKIMSEIEDLKMRCIEACKSI